MNTKFKKNGKLILMERRLREKLKKGKIKIVSIQSCFDKTQFNGSLSSEIAQKF